MHKDTFYRLPVPITQCFIGTEKNLDAGIMLNFDEFSYSQAYSQIKEAFWARTKDGILQTNLVDHDFRSSNEGNDKGYKQIYNHRKI